MSIYTEINGRLGGYTGLTALVSTRIYAVRLPQNVTLPAVSFQVISAPRFSNFGADTGDVRYRIQVDCWTSAPHGASGGPDAVAAQVRAALQRYNGGSIQDVFIEDERDGGFDDEADLFRSILEFTVWFKE